MSVSLGDILAHPVVAAADPVVHSPGTSGERLVRWVHSSEVLDIAPLLRGGELLLCGGITLASATPEKRAAYVRELAQRGIAALAVETGGVLPEIPQAMLEAAEEHGLTVVELRKVVPFVGVMQAINSILVSESVGHLQQADAATRAMAAELAHGASLDQILGVLAGIISSAVKLISPWGVSLGSGVPADWQGNDDGGSSPGGKDGLPEVARGTVLSVDIPVRGVLMGRLEVEIPDGVDAGLARVAGDRAVDILGLALLQHMPPGLHAQAGAELMRAVLTTAPAWRLEQLAPAAGFPADSPAVVVAIHAASPQKLRRAIESFLSSNRIPSAAYQDDAELVVMIALPPTDTAGERRKLLDSMQGLDGDHDATIAVGPLGGGVAEAAWSLAEARRALDVRQIRRRNASPRRRHPSQGLVVVDAEDTAVESLALTRIDASARDAFVNRQLRAVLDHDAQRQSQLLETLEVWLDSGCNTAQSARELHLERQSMHHRLQRIFELCGGDPRGTGRLAALHLAVRMAGLP
ncbi:PucR family transcriptional regulator [Pseudarthrobacter sp. NS4]|uniref:PucR family transcriptional regulator n=1 Tax=Pseudarthrobacter sp. NS4 TaxID=2973976 RepID=UPI0021639002|nr:PucR family transcriptional regulator [Pseudarthrobacter sp. NS4]